MVKVRIYTENHTAEEMARLDPGRRFTAEEHAAVTGRLNKAEILEKSLAEDVRKMWVLDLIVAECLRYHIYPCHMVLSFGAGTCVPEHYLKERLPEVRVIALDFDENYIENARTAFPEIEAVKFDFFKDRLTIPADLAYFLGSSYVMDDAEYVQLLGDLKKNGVKTVIDFALAYIPAWGIPRAVLGDIKGKVFGYRGKWHGFGRTKGELRRIYQEAGWRVFRETGIGPYRYVAVLRR